MDNCYSSPDQVLTPADWRDADLVTGACNLSGVAHSFPEVVKKVRKEAEARGQSWDWADQHPIVKIYVDKFLQLAHVTSAELDDAYMLILRKAKGLP